MKTLTILGSTGSIGRQTLEVVEASAGCLKVHSLVAYKSVELLEQQVRAFQPALAVMMDEDAARELRNRLVDLPVQVEYGMEGVLNSVEAKEVDTIVSAFSGRIGLEPTLAALKKGKAIALANKETLVAAGDLVMRTAKENGCSILPVDSEHAAIFQCLAEARNSKDRTINKIILTASGGPFLGKKAEELEQITPESALKHPNWAMGAKITIDSATMMNKGLEVIEAHHLFEMDYDSIEVLIHPQSIIHSMVEYQDGSILAQLGRPDMRLPIQYALSYPDRWPNSFEKLDLRGKTLTFLEPDIGMFPALKLAYEAGKIGGTMPCVMNAANEIAVQAFLHKRLTYPGIHKSVVRVCEDHEVLQNPDLTTILDVDAWARQRTEEVISSGNCQVRGART